MLIWSRGHVTCSVDGDTCSSLPKLDSNTYDQDFLANDPN